MQKVIVILVTLLLQFFQNAHGQKIESLITNGNFEKAMKKIQANLKKSENDPELLYFLCVIQYKSKSQYYSLQDAYKTYSVLNNQFQTITDLKTIDKLNSKGINSQKIESLSDSIYSKDLTLTLDQNSEISLNQFLERYPQLPPKYKENAIRIRDEIAFNSVCISNSLNDYNDFIKKYPYSDKYQNVKKLRDHLAFQMAKETDTEASLEYFLKNYNDSEDFKNAEFILENKIFARITQSNELTDLINFQRRFPRSEKNAIISRKIEDINFTLLLNKKSLDEYYSYLNEDHPDVFKQAARKELENLKYEKLRIEAHIPSILTFFSEFPDSKFTNELRRIADSLYFDEIKMHAKRDIEKSLNFYNEYEMNFPDSDYKSILKDYLNNNFQSKIDSFQVAESHKFYSTELSLKVIELSEHPDFYDWQLNLLTNRLSFFDENLFSKLEKNIRRVNWSITYFGKSECRVPIEIEKIGNKNNPLLFLKNDWVAYEDNLFKLKNGLTKGISYCAPLFAMRNEQPFLNAGNYIFSDHILVDEYGYIYDLTIDKLISREDHGITRPLLNNFNLDEYKISNSKIYSENNLPNWITSIMPIRPKNVLVDNSGRLLIVSSLELTDDKCYDCRDEGEETTIFIFDLIEQKEITEFPGRLAGISPKNELLLNGNIEYIKVLPKNREYYSFDSNLLPSKIYFDILDLNELLENISLFHNPHPDSTLIIDEFTTLEQLQDNITILQKKYIELNSKEKIHVNSIKKYYNKEIHKRNLKEFELLEILRNNDSIICNCFYKKLNTMPKSIAIPLEYKEYNLNSNTMSFTFRDTTFLYRNFINFLNNSGKTQKAMIQGISEMNWSSDNNSITLYNISPQAGRGLKDNKLELVLEFNKTYVLKGAKLKSPYVKQTQVDNIFLEECLTDYFEKVEFSWIQKTMETYWANNSLYSIYLKIDNQSILLQ